MKFETYKNSQKIVWGIQIENYLFIVQFNLNVQ